MLNSTCKVCKGQNLSPFGEGKGHKVALCDDCGFRFIAPCPSTDDLARFYADYSANAHGYESKLAKKLTRARRRIRRYSSYARGRRFIDIGCSIGTVTAASAEYGFASYGVDLDVGSIDYAKAAFPKGTFHSGGFDSVPRAWGKFDFIYTSEVIEHVPDPHAMLDAIENCAADDAFLFLTAPDAGHIRVPRNFFEWSCYTPPEHLNFFTRNNMRQMLNEHGFDILKIEFNLKPGMSVLARRRSRL